MVHDALAPHDTRRLRQRTPSPLVQLLPALLVLAALCQPAVCRDLTRLKRESEERLIGWKGETYDPEQQFDPLKHEGKAHELPLPASRSWVEAISWKPRAFIYHDFITPAEARHLIEQAAITMKRSTVVGADGKSVEDSYRTSYGTFLRRYQDLIIERVEHRVAAWTQVPVEHQEDTQVLRYGIGQFYKVHSDTLMDDDAGYRIGTVLIYLNDPEEGGETAFPVSEWLHPSLEEQYGRNVSECAKGHVAFKPKKGSALLFWSINPDGVGQDLHSSHTGCPVIKGAKWTATKWIHARPFRPAELRGDVAGRNQALMRNNDPGICEDTNSQCAAWAKTGQCEANKESMISGPTSLGLCRKSCKACQVCGKGDITCFNANRERVGYLSFNASELH